MTPLESSVSDAIICNVTYGHNYPPRVINYAPRVINYAPRVINYARRVINYAPSVINSAPRVINSAPRDINCAPRAINYAPRAINYAPREHLSLMMLAYNILIPGGILLLTNSIEAETIISSPHSKQISYWDQAYKTNACACFISNGIHIVNNTVYGYFTKTTENTHVAISKTDYSSILNNYYQQ